MLRATAVLLLITQTALGQGPPAPNDSDRAPAVGVEQRPAESPEGGFSRQPSDQPKPTLSATEAPLLPSAPAQSAEAQLAPTVPKSAAPTVAELIEDRSRDVKRERESMTPISATPAPVSQEPPPWVIPHFRLLREEEDWTYLANPQMRGHDWADPLKYIPLGSRENWYLTIGGDMRQWFEHYKNEYWGVPPVPPAPNQRPIDGNGYLKQRYMLGADFHFGSRFRAFSELHSGFVNWRAGGPRPIVDNDELDLNQAFVDINLAVDERSRPSVILRVGRQQLYYGTGRLVSVREVPNVRASFDGVRIIVNTHKWRIDTFATKPVLTQQGFFDDRPDHTQTFWGTFATGPVASAPFNLDLSYFGLMRKVGVFNKGIAPETRHTVGARIWRGGIPFVVGSGWDYDVEYAYQFGSFGPGFRLFSSGFLPKADIRAWTISTQTGYTFEGVKLQPRIALNTGITTGDKDPLEPVLRTFFTPYPNGRFFGAIQQNGPLNIQGFRPSFTIQLPRHASLTADSYFFWRQSIKDALYDVPGFPLRPGNLSRARFVGAQPGIEFFWPVTMHVTMDLNYAYFATGQFLHDTPPDKNLRYTGLIFIYRF